MSGVVIVVCLVIFEMMMTLTVHVMVDFFSFQPQPPTTQLPILQAEHHSCRKMSTPLNAEQVRGLITQIDAAVRAGLRTGGIKAVVKEQNAAIVSFSIWEPYDYY